MILDLVIVSQKSQTKYQTLCKNLQYSFTYNKGKTQQAANVVSKDHKLTKYIKY